MDVPAMFNSALQVAAAFLIFIVGYLALMLVIVICLLALEAMQQGVIFARTSLSNSWGDRTELSPVVVTTVQDIQPLADGRIG